MLKKYISCLCFKNNSNREEQVIISIILNGNGWNYLAVKKKTIRLLRGTTSKRLIASIAFILWQHKTNVNFLKKYVKIKILVTL